MGGGGGVKVSTKWRKYMETRMFLDLSRSDFQSSNLIGRN